MNKNLEIRNQILNTIIKNGVSIITNSFGNYMVQHIFTVYKFIKILVMGSYSLQRSYQHH